MGHQSFRNHNFCPAAKFCMGIADRGIHTFNLYGFHFHIAACAHLNICFRVHNPFAIAVAHSVMLFNIFNLGICPNKKAVNTVVAAAGTAAVMNPTTSNNCHIAAVTHIKVIIYNLGKARLAYNNRDMKAFFLCSRLHINI